MTDVSGSKSLSAYRVVRASLYEIQPLPKWQACTFGLSGLLHCHNQ